jgi:TolA-binding protein
MESFSMNKRILRVFLVSISFLGLTSWLGFTSLALTQVSESSEKLVQPGAFANTSHKLRSPDELFEQQQQMQEILQERWQRQYGQWQRQQQQVQQQQINRIQQQQLMRQQQQKRQLPL